MSTPAEMLQSSIELAKGITTLTQVTDQAIIILARAILELDGNATLSEPVYNAVTTLAEGEAKEAMNYDQWKSTEPDDSDVRYFSSWRSAEAWAKRTSQRAKNRIKQMDEYEIRHDAMALLWSIIEQTEEPLHRRILSAITYLRESAYDTLPWPGDVLPNKRWDGKRT